MVLRGFNGSIVVQENVNFWMQTPSSKFKAQTSKSPSAQTISKPKFKPYTRCLQTNPGPLNPKP